mmetsp:Transcript_23869/g.70317  ORF Transcript_23869/g.70317 Transcript_23869/m.70317 type:complete len:235 (-) Transcript_23869:625-1329(-)
MHDGAVSRELAELRHVLLHSRRQRRSSLLLGGLAQKLGRVEGGQVGHDRLGCADLATVAKADACTPATLDEHLLHVGVELQGAAVLLQTTHEGVGDVASAADGHGEGGLLVEEALENVEHVRRHRALGREAAEDAHGVDEVAQEGHGHVLVHDLMQRVEEHVEVSENIRVCRDIGQRARCGGEEARVLAEVEERHRHRGAGEGAQALAQGIPLLDGERPVFAALLQQRLLEGGL